MGQENDLETGFGQYYPDARLPGLGDRFPHLFLRDEIPVEDEEYRIPLFGFQASF